MVQMQSSLIANKGKSNMAKFRHLGFSNISSLSPGKTDSGAGVFPKDAQITILIF